MSRTEVHDSKNNQFVFTEGTVIEERPELEYVAEIEFKGLTHTVLCYVSGKMKKNFIQIRKGDKVQVKISLYDIDKGIIIRRLNSRALNYPRAG